MKKFNKVIIVGSGVGWGLGGIPIQNKFWEGLKEHIKKQREFVLEDFFRDELKDFDDLIYLKKLESAAENIGQFFSRLHDIVYSKIFPDRQVKAALNLMIFYRKAIVSWLMGFQREVNQRNIGSELKYPDEWNAKETVFISMNFDEIFEKLILKNNFYFPYFLKEPGGSHPVLKPHGSNSWFEIRLRNRLNFLSYTDKGYRFLQIKKLLKEPIFKRLEEEKFANLNSHPFNGSLFMEADNLEYGLTPLLIPFYRQKKIWYSGRKWSGTLGENYIESVKAISRCKELWIIGYGMPAADWTFAEAFCGVRKDVQIRIVLLPDGANCCNIECCCAVHRVRPEAVARFCKVFSRDQNEMKTYANKEDMSSNFVWIPWCAKRFFEKWPNG